MKIDEKDYIDYLAHMLDESCNEKACNNGSRREIDEDDFELKPLGYRKPRSGSPSHGKLRSGKPNTKFSLD